MNPYPGDTCGISCPIGPATSNTPANPAQPPPISMAAQTRRPSRKPAKRAAAGASPATRAWKPNTERDTNTHANGAAAKDSSVPQVGRWPSSNGGSIALSANMRECGKLKPSGSFQGPCTSATSTSCAT